MALFHQLAQYDNYTTTTTTSNIDTATLMPILIVVGVLVIISIIGMWKVFVKAGRPGWAAIIPIYNLWVLCEISGKPGWWALLACIPYVGGLIWLVLGLLQSLALAEKFNRSGVFAVFGLWLFGFVGYPMLGFGKDVYNGSASVSGQGPAAPTAPQGPVVQ